MALTGRALLAAVAASVSLAAVTGAAQEKFITVASTTSTEQSGLFKHILPEFAKKTGVQVRVVALGTGQALDVGRRGDADVVFVHDKPAEEKFIAEGSGVERKEVMYNDFILIGPKSDPAKIAGGKDIVAALKQVKAAQAPFVSRGDKSGTHAAELRYWKAAGVDLEAKKGAWYKDTGSGMGPTLNTASAATMSPWRSKNWPATPAPLSRVATRAARTRPNCAIGSSPASTSRRPSRRATRNAAAAWDRR